MLRFGIISFAHMHANDYASAIKALDRDASLVAICDDNQDRGRAKAHDFGVEHFFADYKAMLGSGLIDAVVIASENSYHVEQVCAAAEAGKHIICEKPLSATKEELARMEAAVGAQASSLPLARLFFQTAFVMRYDATVADAKEKIDSGAYGAIKAIAATNHGTYPGGWFAEKPLSGGGAIIDHTVHVADLVRYFTGDEFGVVRAYQGKNIRPNISVEDNALLYCRMQKSDMPISIDCSWSRLDGWPTWGDVCMNIVCERGLIRLDCFKPHLNVVSHGRFSWQGLNENLSKKMVAGFCRAVRDGVEPTASFNDGAQAARVAFAAYESLQCGSQPVSLK